MVLQTPHGEASSSSVSRSRPPGRRRSASRRRKPWLALAGPALHRTDAPCPPGSCPTAPATPLPGKATSARRSMRCVGESPPASLVARLSPKANPWAKGGPAVGEGPGVRVGRGVRVGVGLPPGGLTMMYSSDGALPSQLGYISADCPSHGFGPPIATTPLAREHQVVDRAGRRRPILGIVRIRRRDHVGRPGERDRLLETAPRVGEVVDRDPIQTTGQPQPIALEHHADDGPWRIDVTDGAQPPAFIHGKSAHRLFPGRDPDRAPVRRDLDRGHGQRAGHAAREEPRCSPWHVAVHGQPGPFADEAQVAVHLDGGHRAAELCLDGRWHRGRRRRTHDPRTRLGTHLRRHGSPCGGQRHPSGGEYEHRPRGEHGRGGARAVDHEAMVPSAVSARAPGAFGRPTRS